MFLSKRIRQSYLAGLCAMVVTGHAAAQQPRPDLVVANDNNHPAGRPDGPVTTITLVAAQGQWRPEENDGPSLEVAAFGEEGGPLLVPGPLMRVVESTDVIVKIHNTLAERLDVHGLVTHPSDTDSVFSVAAGESREIRFSSGAPGTYHYWATTGGAAALNTRRGFDSQLGGAFVVDPKGAPARDRVLVMTEWNGGPAAGQSTNGPARDRLVFAINGLSWPHTERLDQRLGDDVRWHIVNLTQTVHPMHLHGFFFTVRGVGRGLRYTTYQESEYRRVVTEPMPLGGTTYTSWTPERAGNWLLHCHLLEHISPALRFWAPPEQGAHANHAAHDPLTAMAGLVMGIRVTADEGAAARHSEKQTDEHPTIAPRQITLVMHRRAGYWHPEDAYGFALKKGQTDPGPEEATVPGPLLVLTRDEPVEITLKNELPEPTAIHWHGIELGSYFDGIPGWSGSSTSTTPAIEPHQSFVVRFTPPRAGTFMYHTHANDDLQLASGLYGAIVVLEPGETFDPARDHVVLLGMGGPKDTVRYQRFPVVVNGDERLSIAMKAGVANRFRLINITTNFGGLNVSLVAFNQPVQWRPIAKDGADLPIGQQSVRPAVRQGVEVGETYDFLVDPPQLPGAWLEVRRASGEWVQQVPIRVQR
jgi:FtsP/CotA-like multicopper oxidase with cupredoxin domain